ncbi:MAG: hypothetical protein A3D92_21375 [Bacteroidetes bacterium RIFCSPHIGHO2_02_FULL_44_7]|nr:MAG: hypothetical protein A3D92_21375 [Bacteroidetes bacterium RIFCSPHIGHO2_02_FULL_44_7]
MKKTFLFDLIAGLTVSFAALSLGAAFGLMSGRGAISGIIGAAVIPLITSLLGGTRIQASGPTAPMTAVTAVIIAFAHDEFAHNNVYAEQLITLTLLFSSLLIIMTGLFRLGKYIKFVPQVVVLGFMNGIGVLIWVDQIKLLLGLNGKGLSGNMGVNVILTLSTLLLIYSIPYLFRKLKVPTSISRFLPSILITILIITFCTTYFQIDVEKVKLDSEFKSFQDYWRLIVSYFPSESSLYSWKTFLLITPYAIQLCVLAYLDSLLTSLVIDRITKEKTKPNKELIAQGIANTASTLLQGIPGAQATIRSVLLVNEGAKTRLAGVILAVFTLLGFLVFSNLITLIASAVFVGILLKAGLDVLDRDFVMSYVKNYWHKDRKRNVQLIFITYTTLVTVLVNLNVAVITGTLAFYLLKRFVEITDSEADFSEVHAEELLGTPVAKK